MDSVVRHCGAKGRTYKSALIFCVPDAAENIREAARNLLAWEGIDEDDETKARLDESQKRVLAKSLGRAKGDLEETIFRSYRNLFLLGADGNLRHIDLGQITSSMANSLVDLIVNELSRTDEITRSVGANKLVKYWPPALTEWSTKSVGDAFYSSAQLPRLRDPGAIKRTISDGVTQGTLGYATKDSGGQLVLQRFGQSMGEAEVEISDDAFVLKAEDAKKLLDPPRLSQLVIQPAQATMKPGEEQAFACSGRDQYAKAFATPAVSWTAKGGEVTSDGVFTAGEHEGRYTVHAGAAGLEAIAEVRITDRPSPPPPPHKHIIRWSGDVPAQKWMNFYTKVLSRFATSSGLTLHVSFHVPSEGEQGQAKAEEARMGLKELGLNDDVQLQ
jgi:hypothetical protein